MMICPFCGHINDSKGFFCEECGSRLQNRGQDETEEYFPISPKKTAKTSLIMGATVLAVAAILIAGALFYLSANKQDESVSAAVPAVTDGTSKPATVSTVNANGASPYGAGSTAAQSVGRPLDGLKIDDIRWADHGRYFRIVYDLTTMDGHPATKVPSTEVSYIKDGKTLRVLVNGIRGNSTKPNVHSGKIILNDSLVLSINTVATYDDQAYTYEIDLASASPFVLTGLDAQGKIIVDINRR